MSQNVCLGYQVGYSLITGDSCTLVGGPYVGYRPMQESDRGNRSHNSGRGNATRCEYCGMSYDPLKASQHYGLRCPACGAPA